MEERLKNRSIALLNTIKLYIKEVERNHLTDKQWFLTWEDSINKLSIKDHNAGPE